MKQLLVPINFSEVAKAALPFAAAVARKHGSIITLLTSGASPLTEDNLSQELGRDLPKEMATRQFVLREALEELAAPYQQNGLAFDFVIQDGIVMRDIVKEAEAKSYDLIVMGTKGVQIPAEEIWGTFAANLISEVDTPMLIVPEGNQPAAINRIVLATDLKGDQTGYIARLRALKDIFHAELSCLHITQEPEQSGEIETLDLTADYFFTPIDPVNVEIRYDERVSQGLKAYLEEHRSSILAIRPQHRGFIESLFHTSVSRQLALHSQNPIFILRDEKR